VEEEEPTTNRNEGLDARSGGNMPPRWWENPGVIIRVEDGIPQPRGFLKPLRFRANNDSILDLHNTASDNR